MFRRKPRTTRRSTRRWTSSAAQKSTQRSRPTQNRQSCRTEGAFCRPEGHSITVHERPQEDRRRTGSTPTLPRERKQCLSLWVSVPDEPSGARVGLARYSTGERLLVGGGRS